MNELILPAPLWRRLAAAFYDGLLLLALWMILALADVLVRDAFGLPRDPRSFRALLFLGGFAFCGRFWTHGGQTLGMRAWRLRVRRADGGALNWPLAALRYAIAWLAWLPLGLGVLWCAVDPRRRAWHDLLSGTEIIQIPDK